MNILFYIFSTVDPEHGGIHRVTEVLLKAFAKRFNVYCLMAKKTLVDTQSNHYYLPNKDELMCRENINYAQQLQQKLRIDFIINQDAISPYSSAFILEAKNENVKLLSVVHNSISSIYGMDGKLPMSIQNRLPFIIRNSINLLCVKYFKYKYLKQWKKMYRRSDKLIMLDDAYIDEMKSFLECADEEQKIISIPNPVTLITEEVIKTKEHKKVLYVGRLSYEKNVKMLLQIWSLVQEKHPDWSLDIVGEGELRSQLERYVCENNIHRVTFYGKQNPIRYYNEASIFCMTSFFEGMPLVLLEAMAFGCIPIAFNSFKSVSSIIDNEKDGYIIPAFNIIEYANCLSQLMHLETLRATMTVMTIRKSQMFSVDNIINKWHFLFENLLY